MPVPSDRGVPGVAYRTDTEGRPRLTNALCAVWHREQWWRERTRRPNGKVDYWCDFCGMPRVGGRRRKGT
jgi:hypothetical protein